MKKAAVDALLLAQREKYLSLLRQVLPMLELGSEAMDEEAMKYHAAMAGYRPEEHARLDANCEQAGLVLQDVREALK